MCHAWARELLSVPIAYVSSTNLENIQDFQLKIFFFASEKIAIYCIGLFS